MNISFYRLKQIPCVELLLLTFSFSGVCFSEQRNRWSLEEFELSGELSLETQHNSNVNSLPDGQSLASQKAGWHWVLASTGL
jgi:hypothetical protein